MIKIINDISVKKTYMKLDYIKIYFKQNKLPMNNDNFIVINCLI